MGNLIRVLFNTLKAKIVPIWTKIKLWTNPTFIRTRVVVRIQKFFRSLLDIRPRNKKDYYGIFGWLVSKRLAFVIIIALGLFSAYFIFVVNAPAFRTNANDSIKTYAYDSLPLRFTKGTVRIKAKSGYVAYEGNVEKGKATGKGTLFRNDGTVVYDGMFENSKYNGAGKQFFPSGQLMYSGEFANNQFEGNGKLYLENGSLEYEGGFLSGKKEGSGILYDASGNEIFTGNFSKDHLLFSDFLGKTTQEAGSIYTGQRILYSDANYFTVYMPQIHGMIFGMKDADALDGSIEVKGVYHLSDTFWFSDKELDKISDVKKVLGEVLYEGNSYVTMPDAVAVNLISQQQDTSLDPIEIKLNQEFVDAAEVSDFDKEYIVYLHTMSKDGMLYTFYGMDRSDRFFMYSIEIED